jgi:hypothetical protein
MNRLQFLRIRTQTPRHGRIHGSGVNYARSVWMKRRLIGTNSYGKPVVCIVGSGPAGFYTAQYLLKVVYIVKRTSRKLIRRHPQDWPSLGVAF